MRTKLHMHTPLPVSLFANIQGLRDVLLEETCNLLTNFSHHHYHRQPPSIFRACCFLLTDQSLGIRPGRPPSSLLPAEVALQASSTCLRKNLRPMFFSPKSQHFISLCHTRIRIRVLVEIGKDDFPHLPARCQPSHGVQHLQCTPSTVSALP